MNTENNLLFSIIIPVYQCEKTLDACIQSVLSQDVDSYEVILVDDGSADSSGKICDDYAEAFPGRFTVIHKKNEGPLLARMDAIETARGQYYMFLDSDDRYLPGVLSRVKNALETFRADMVLFNYYRAFPDGSIRLCEAKYSDGEVFAGPGMTRLYTDALTRADLNALWQKCISRSCFPNTEQFRQYGKLFIGEDKLLSFAMLDNAEKVVYLADGLYEYHITQQSLSHSRSYRHYQDMALVHQQTLRYMSIWKLQECMEQCCRDKVEFGLSCLHSAAKNALTLENGASEFKAIAKRIYSDPDYWEAFRSCRMSIPKHKRIACRLLHHKCIGLARVYFSAGIIAKRVKHSSFRPFRADPYRG